MWRELKEKFRDADFSNYPFHIGLKGRPDSTTNNTAAYLTYRKRWVDYPKQKIVSEFPLCIDIEPAFACNLRCTMCYTREIDGYDNALPESRLMPFETARQVIDEGSGYQLPSLKLTGRGEALLNEELEKMIRHAKDKGIMDTMFNTNVTLLSEKRIEQLIQARLDLMIVSLDGLTKEVYEGIRKGASFTNVIGKIEKFVATRDLVRRHTPRLRIQIVCMQENKREILQFVEQWRGVADEINLIRFRSFTDMVRDRRKLYKGELKKVPCRQLWQRLYVAYNGDIHMCCADYKGREVLGNISRNTIHSIWHSKRLNQIRQYHMALEFNKIPVCMACPSNYEADFWGWLDEEERS
jgi:radical SAM protein with 4Fe4S-binding SPASM domain